MRRTGFIAAALALLVGMGLPAQAFDVGMMDAANSLPAEFVGAANLPPRSHAMMSGYAPSAVDQWNVPLAWSRAGETPSRGWAHNLPTGTDQWNVPLWFTRPTEGR